MVTWMKQEISFSIILSFVFDPLAYKILYDWESEYANQ
jgi:nucleoside permease NupC